MPSGAEKAAQVVDRRVRRVDGLRDHPQLGRIVPEYGRWQLRELVDKWNRVLYRLRSDAHGRWTNATRMNSRGSGRRALGNEPVRDRPDSRPLRPRDFLLR
jgi:plasmid stabilization system protein ParE